MTLVTKKVKGITLVIVISLLLLLSTTAVTFIKLAAYNRITADNFQTRTAAQLMAFAGIDHASSFIFEQLHEFGYVQNTSELFPFKPEEDYKLEKSMFPKTFDKSQRYISLQNGTISIKKEKVTNIIYSHLDQGSGKASTHKTYSTKIVNLASRFNINSHISSSQRHSNIVVNNILRDLALKCGIEENLSINIANKIRPLDSSYRAYESMEQIKDKLQMLVGGTITKNEQVFLDNLCVHSWVDTKTCCWEENKINVPPTYIKEQRAPIDINHVSTKLLYSIIHNIRATKFFHVNKTIIREEQNFQDNQPNANFESSQELISLTLDFEQVNVDGLIEDLIFDSDNNRLFYTTYSQFEKAIDGLDEKYFPECPIAEISFPVWKQSWLDALKSNFNPNLMDNYWNANAPVHRNVTKGDLYIDNLPSHTTEICFSSRGRFEITAVGAVISKHNGDILSLRKIKTFKNFAEIISHTTQSEFESDNSNFDNTLCYPEDSGLAQDELSGRVEPMITIEKSFLNSNEIFSVDFTQTFSPGGNPRADLVQPMVKSSQKRSDQNNNIAKDGIFSLFTQYDGNQTPERYYIENTIENQHQTTENHTTEPYTDSKLHHNVIIGRDVNNDNAYNEENNKSKIANYKGALEFWIKLNVHGASDIECGILSINQTGIERLSGLSTLKKIEGYEDKMKIVKIPYKEGTQMTLVKDSQGKLRLTRIYYAAFFDNEGKVYGTKYSLDGDENRKYPRRDVVVSVPDWEPHVWHHVVVIWDDTIKSLEDSLKLVIDGQETSTSHYMGDGEQPLFCVLSERDKQPIQGDTILTEGVTPLNNGYNHTNSVLDGISYNGIFKRQIIKNEIPLNKHNATFRGGNNVHLVGNATISHFVSYDTAQKKIKSPFPIAERFSMSKAHTYNNSFTINKKGTLGVLRWTSFPELSINEVGPTVSLNANFSGTPYKSPESTDLSDKRLFTELYKNVSSEDVVKYNVDFLIPQHKQMLDSSSYNGSVPVALECVELMVLFNQDLEIVFD